MARLPSGVRITFAAILVDLGTSSAQNFVDMKPSPQEVEWQALEFGVIIHFGTNAILDRE
jgi:alpha-L-fucosidase